MNLVSEYRQFRMSRAFNGGSILDLPLDMRVLAKGFYFTSDPKNFKPLPKTGAQPLQKPPSQPQKEGDSKVVLTALARLLKGNQDKNIPYEELGQSRPLR